MKPLSIKGISQYGFLTLIAGSLLSGGILLYFLFVLDTIKEEQQVTEDTYDALFELKYLTERLLTTYDLAVERKAWLKARYSFENALQRLEALRGEQTETFNNLWAVIQKEIDTIDRQLDHPLFQAKNTMDKSLLRRLGEGLNSNAQSEYYIRMNRLFNAIEYLKQYESFLLDELADLRDHNKEEVALKLSQTRQYAVVFPSVILLLTLFFAMMISRLIGRNEQSLIRTRESLQVSLDEFEHLFDTTMEAIFLLEGDRCIDANEKSIRMFGFKEKSKVIGISLYDLMSPELRHSVSELLGMDESEPRELTAVTADGCAFPVLYRGHNFMSQGRTIRIAAMLDLTDLKEKDRALQQTVRELQENQEKLLQQQRILDHMAHHDILTGLPNRTFFLEHLQQAISHAREAQRSVAIFFIDLDRFKEINDSLGHALGDRVLEVVADRLRLSIGSSAALARIGGDEFTVVVEADTSEQRLGNLAENIIELLQKPMHVEEHELYITTSIGISVYPDDGESEIMLLSNADAAMYRAKAQGRNTYRFYTADLTSQAYERVIMERNLRKAMEEKRFVLYYQPQVDAREKRIVSVEALIRWPQDDGSMIPPDRFIPLAEDTGRIVELGMWVLREACRQIVRWKEMSCVIERVAVNVSGKQLYQSGFYDGVVKTLEATGCRPEWLELEVTEGYVMVDPEYCIGILKRLKALGITLSVDDFGTGYSSMTYLKELPVDTLKIDQSFVRGLPGNKDDSAIVHTVIALAKHMNLKLIAEGVETEEQGAFLLAAGCRYHQGYHYARPLPVEEVERLIREA